MDKQGNPIGSVERKPQPENFFEGKELERWQRYFCDMANVFICCLDSYGNPLTPLEGNGEEALKINKIIDGEQFQNMLLRVSKSTLEDQAIETTVYPNVRLAVISGKAAGKPVINWLVCGVLSDADDIEDYEKPPLEGITCLIGRKQFERAVDAIRGMTDMMIHDRRCALQAGEESERSRKKQQEAEKESRRTKVFIEMMQIPLNGHKGESAANKLLAFIGNFLDVSAAGLCRNRGKSGRVDIVSKWCDEKSCWDMDKEIGGREFTLFKRERAVVLSAGSMVNDREKEELAALGLKSVIVMPVVLRGRTSMRVFFGDTQRERAWELDEIKFVNDSVKILQKILPL